MAQLQMGQPSAISAGKPYNEHFMPKITLHDGLSHPTPPCIGKTLSP